MTDRRPGHASNKTSGGTRRAAYRTARATTTMSSSGPMTGRNSGIRSIGDNTHNPANPTANLARRGTRGSRHRRRVNVTQSGKKLASSFNVPFGSRAANTTKRSHDANRAPTPNARRRSTMRS